MSHKDYAPQPSSPLLRLPGELRNQILQYIVTQPEPIALKRSGTPFSIDVNILSSCRQLRAEASYFLYHDNILEVDVASHGYNAMLHFSKHHMVCEYRANAAVEDVLNLFLDRFSRIQFRIQDQRTRDSLWRVLKRIAPLLSEKHLSVVLPPPRSGSRRTSPTGLAGTSRPRAYPSINSPLLPFSLLRCASFAVIQEQHLEQQPQAISSASDLRSAPQQQHDKLIDLVTSARPSIDMTQLYADIQRTARAIDKMAILPSSQSSFEAYDELHFALLDHMRESCECANRADQDAFLAAVGRFEECYRKMQELQ